MFSMPHPPIDPPEADHSRCVVCGDEAYDRQDRDDGPYAESADGDGVVCSATCALVDRMRDLKGYASATALLEGLNDGAKPELVRIVLEPSDSAPRGTPARLEVVGTVVEHDAETITLEDAEGETGSLPWSHVLEAEVIEA